MKNETHNHFSGGGIGIGGLLAVAFVVLKLCGVITWPWLWVLSPLWIPIAILLCCVALPFVLLAIAGIAFGIIALLAHFGRKQKPSETLLERFVRKHFPRS